MDVLKPHCLNSVVVFNTFTAKCQNVGIKLLAKQQSYLKQGLTEGSIMSILKIGSHYMPLSYFI
jgi:hypothetical protein